MASNFNILLHQNSDNIHLRLTGDFDGSSAHELINAVRLYSLKASRVFIHCDALNKIYSLGSGLFKNSISELAREGLEIVFTGSNAKQMLSGVNGGIRVMR